MPTPAPVPTGWSGPAAPARRRRAAGLAGQEVWPFSTGVIMEPLPVDRIVAGLPRRLPMPGEDNWLNAALGIMTTDTVPKAFSARAQVGGATITVTGISKGAGMIRPNMATMLGFMATDACVDQALMQQLSRELPMDPSIASRSTATPPPTTRWW
jgi:glutamate N-acetyltransferase/amino-acid N-acetyltransferase